jgi:hypothetical protein
VAGRDFLYQEYDYASLEVSVRNRHRVLALSRLRSSITYDPHRINNI